MWVDAEEALPLFSWDKESSITIKSVKIAKVHLYNDSVGEKKDDTGIEEECLELFKSIAFDLPCINKFQELVPSR